MPRPGLNPFRYLALVALLLAPLASALAAERVILLPDEDGGVGAVVVSTKTDSEELTKPNSVVKLYSRALGPYLQRGVSPAEIQQEFRRLLELRIAPDDPLDTLPEIVELTLATHPEAMGLVHIRQARNRFTLEAASGFLPRVNLVGESGYEWTRSPGTRNARRAAGLDDIEFVNLPRREITFSVRQMLFDGWETASEVARRTADADAFAYQWQARAERLATQVASAFMNLLRDNDLVELANRNLASHQEIVEQIRARSESGVGRDADLEQAEGRLALAETDVIEGETALRDALIRYVTLVGYPPQEVLQRPEATRDGLPGTLDEALRLAQQRHPALLDTEADLRAAELQATKNARSLQYPRIELEFSTRHGDDLDGVEGENDDVRMMFHFDWNLYNGGADRAKVRRSLALVEQGRDLRDRTSREITEVVRQAWNAADASERRLGLIEQQVTAMVKALDAYREQFKIGERTLLDVLDAENELYRARRTLVEARRNYATSLYRLRGGMGILVAHFGSTLPPEALPSTTYTRTP